MIALIDYGVGNLFSLRSSFKAAGYEVTVTSDPDDVAHADRVILPGVGAFADARAKLREKGMDEAVVQAAKAGTPLMGICLGHQMLFETALEKGEHEGLGLFGGTVRPIETGLKVPQIGWNRLDFTDHPLFSYIENGDYAYFLHSYWADPTDPSIVIATCEYGAPLTAAVARDNVIGCQFHPEKSAAVGQKILKAFCEL